MGHLLLLGVGGKGVGVDLPPVITSANTASNLENTVLAHALTASESVTWSIIGGADSAKFDISGSTLRWLANGTKDYEVPDDADANNAYVVQVRATDTGSLTADQTITVTVTDDATEPWALVGSWTHSINVAQVDFTGLAGYSEVRVLARLVSSATGGAGRRLLVSTDNGATFLNTSGDYIEVPSTGVEANATGMRFSSLDNSPAQSGEIIIAGWNLTAPKLAHSRTQISGASPIRTYIIPTASPLNALSINSTSGNLSGGSIYVWAR